MTEVSTLATTGEAARAVAEWLDRLDDVLERLRAHVDAEHAGRTRPDPGSTERVNSGLLIALTDADWERVGVHSKLGQMTIDRQLDEFHIGHYEEHADQLDSIA